MINGKNYEEFCSNFYEAISLFSKSFTKYFHKQVTQKKIFVQDGCHERHGRKRNKGQMEGKEKKGRKHEVAGGGEREVVNMIFRVPQRYYGERTLYSANAN